MGKKNKQNKQQDPQNQAEQPTQQEEEEELLVEQDNFENNQKQKQEDKQNLIQQQQLDDKQFQDSELVENQKLKSDAEQQQENQENSEDSEKCTVFQAQINLFKGLVGLGILALPIGFSQVGWVLGISMIPIVGYVMYYCATLMLDLADSRNINPANIAEFCYIMFRQPGIKGSGQSARFWVTVFLFCLQLGMCIGYTIFFINYFQASFCHFGWDLGCEDRIYAVIFALAIVIPLGLIRNIKNLKGPSNIANLILIGALIVMLYDCYTQIQRRGPQLEKSVDFWGLANYIGIVVFTLEGVGLFFDIRHSMQEPKEFKPALLNVVHVAVLMYIVMGFMGYMAFGKNVADLLLFNLPMNNDFYYSVQIAYALVICLTFPLQLFPIANYLEIEIKHSLFAKPINTPQIQSQQDQQQQQTPQNDQITSTPGQQQEQQQNLQEDDSEEVQQVLELNEQEQKTLTKYSYGMRIVLTLGIFCVAMTLKKVSVFLNLAGCIGGIALLYIIPVLIFNLNAQNVTQKKLITNWVITGIGIFAGMCGIYVSLMEIKEDMENGLDLFFF